jgi:hypothetical protein
VHSGCFYSGSAQPEWRGPNPSWPFSLRAKTGDSILPFSDAAPLVDFGRPAVTRRTRWCWGGTPDLGEPVGGSRAEGGSLQRSSGGEGRRWRVDDDDGSDGRSAAVKV